MKYRDSHKIISDILRSCLESKNKTRIMYENWLSYTQMKSYVSFLIENNLLIKSKNDLFTTTEKGKKFLKLSDEMKSFFKTEVTT